MNQSASDLGKLAKGIPKTLTDEQREAKRVVLAESRKKRHLAVVERGRGDGCANCGRPLKGEDVVVKHVTNIKGEEYSVARNICRYCTVIHVQRARHRRNLPPRSLDPFPSDDFPWKLWREKIDACDGKCPKCQRTARLSLDHILAFSHGGGLQIENITPICSRCNSSKGNKPPSILEADPGCSTGDEFTPQPHENLSDRSPHVAKLERQGKIKQVDTSTSPSESTVVLDGEPLPDYDN